MSDRDLEIEAAEKEFDVWFEANPNASSAARAEAHRIMDARLAAAELLDGGDVDE